MDVLTFLLVIRHKAKPLVNKTQVTPTTKAAPATKIRAMLEVEPTVMPVPMQELADVILPQEPRLVVMDKAVEAMIVMMMIRVPMAVEATVGMAVPLAGMKGHP